MGAGVTGDAWRTAASVSGGAAGPHSKWHHKKTRLSQAVPAGAEWHRGCQVVYEGSAIKLLQGLDYNALTRQPHSVNPTQPDDSAVKPVRHGRAGVGLTVLQSLK